MNINMYKSLLKFEHNGTGILPALANSWTISDNGLVYTFKLQGRRQVP